MYWIYELNKLCCADKRAHVKLKDGDEFDCTPDCLTYDDDGNEEMRLMLDDGSTQSHGNDEIEEVIAI